MSSGRSVRLFQENGLWKTINCYDVREATWAERQLWRSLKAQERLTKEWCTRAGEWRAKAERLAGQNR